MSEQRKVLCDHCGADLTYSNYSIDWSIRVMNRQIPCNDGAVADMYIYAPLKSNLDFCGTGCLRKWVEQDIKNEKENFEKSLNTTVTLTFPV